MDRSDCIVVRLNSLVGGKFTMAAEALKEISFSTSVKLRKRTIVSPSWRLAELFFSGYQGTRNLLLNPLLQL